MLKWLLHSCVLTNQNKKHISVSTFSLYLLNLPDVFQLLCWPTIARIQTFTCSLGISPSHGNLLLTSFPMGGLANPSLQPIRWTERETAFHSLVTPYLRKEVREHRAALCSLCAPKLFFFFFSPSPTISRAPPPVHFCHSLLCLSVPCLHSIQSHVL